MDPDNLLININFDSNHHTNGRKKQMINDIDSGTVDKMAQQSINSSATIQRNRSVEKSTSTDYAHIHHPVEDANAVL